MNLGKDMEKIIYKDTAGLGQNKFQPFIYERRRQMDKSSFLIYLDYEEQFNLLTDEQVGQLMRAIIKYERTREIPQLDGVIKMAFSFIKTQLDRDREKYEARCEKNRENAKRGGRPKKANGLEKTERF